LSKRRQIPREAIRIEFVEHHPSGFLRCGAARDQFPPAVIEML
jgi:hypothetical protein